MKIKIKKPTTQSGKNIMYYQTCLKIIQHNI